MEFQKPAAGIMLTRDLGNAKYYRVMCECGDPNDDIMLEVGSDDIEITVHVWTNTKSNWWANAWYKRIFNKLVITWRLWVHGSIETESWTILNKQAAFNFAETLRRAIHDVEEHKTRPIELHPKAD
jgi:hypothetical protein